MPSARRGRIVSWARFRVTVVSLVAVLILLVLLYLLTGSTLLRPQARLYLYIPDATGIEPGSAVEVNGIPIGEVTAVQLTGSNQPNRIVKVTLDVVGDRLSTITTDSFAQIDSESLIGDKLISITSGKNGPTVRPGSELTFKPQADLMKSLDLTQFEAELRTVDAMITDIEQGRSELGKFIQGEDMYSVLNRRVHDIESAVRAAADTASSMGEALYTDKLYRKVSDPIVKMDQSLAQLESGQGDAGHFLRDPTQYESFRKEIADFRKSIADLKAQPLMTSDAMYTDSIRTITAWIRNVEAANANPLFNTSEAYDNLTGSMKDLQQKTKEFREDPKKFLRLKVF